MEGVYVIGHHSVSHFLFADNSLHFCCSIGQECRALKSTLSLYERALRQTINYGKSGIFFSTNVDAETWDKLKRILGVSANLNTGRYLGLPSLIGKGKMEIFLFFCDRLWSKLQFWRKKKVVQSEQEGVNKGRDSKYTFLLYEHF